MKQLILGLILIFSINDFAASRLNEHRRGRRDGRHRVFRMEHIRHKQQSRKQKTQKTYCLFHEGFSHIFSEDIVLCHLTSDKGKCLSQSENMFSDQNSEIGDTGQMSRL